MEERYPVDLKIEYPEAPSRGWAVLTILVIPKLVILIPHFVILWFLQIGAFLSAAVSQFVVVFSGRYPRKLFDFVVAVARWRERLMAYLFGLTNEYPPFSLK